MNQLIYALVIIPMILLLAIAVFDNMASNSRTTYEVAVVNETTATNSTGAKILTYPCKLDSVTFVSNQTVAYTNYTVAYGDGYSADCTVTIGSDGTGNHVVSYTSYQGNAWTQFTNIRNGTNNGFTLGSMLPYVYIAITVIAVILGAFGISKIL